MVVFRKLTVQYSSETLAFVITLDVKVYICQSYYSLMQLFDAHKDMSINIIYTTTFTVFHCSRQSSPCSTKRAWAGAHLPLLGLEPVGGEPLMSVTCGRCDARPTATFPATRHHRPLADTKLYCLVTEAHVLTTCPGLHSIAERPEFELSIY